MSTFVGQMEFPAKPLPPSRLAQKNSSGILQSPMQHLKIYLDGEFVNEPDAKISLFDHGLLYGDGVFQGIRFYNGRVFLLEEHLDRLFDSAKAILLTIPMERAALREAV